MSSGKRKPLVLIVEDNEDWRDSIQDLLTPLEIRLELASSHRVGLEIAERHPPNSVDPIDLTILDMRMPYKEKDYVKTNGGLDFLGVQQLYDLLDHNSPIIVFTAYDSYDDCIEAIKAGAYYYLPKSDPRPDVNSSQRLLEMCKEILFPPEKTKEKQRELPDEKWFDLHHEEVRTLYAGKSVVFLPAQMTVEDNPAVSSNELDGVKMIAADSYTELRRYILDNPEVRELFPLIVFIEGGEK